MGQIELRMIEKIISRVDKISEELEKIKCRECVVLEVKENGK